MGRNCKYCGQEVEEGALYCPNCGKKLAEEEPVIQDTEEVSEKRPKKTAWKIAAGILAVALIGGVGYGAYQYAFKSKSVKSENGKTGSKVSKVTLNEDEIEQAKTLKENVDGTYVGNVCTYLGDVSSPEEITDEEFQNMCAQAFEYYCALNQYKEGSHYSYDEGVNIDPYFNKIVIDDDQLISKTGEAGSTQKWTFKGSALDKFKEVLGIDRDISIDSNNIQYDGDKYTVTFSENLKGDVQYEEISTLVDSDTGEVIINMKKDEVGDDDKKNSTKKHIVVAQADNECGYSIKSIEDDYVEKALPLETINGEGVALRIALGLDNYDSSKKISDETLEQLAQQGYEYALSTGVTERNGEEGQYSYNRSMFDEMCELIGADVGENVKIENDDVTLNDDTYEINVVDDNMYDKTCYLREEVDSEKQEASFYYLIAHEEGDKTVGYTKKTIAVKPANNLCGYEIKQVKTEEWDDEYTDELKEIDAKEAELIDQQAQTMLGGDEYRKLEQEAIDLWLGEMQNIVTKVSEKYPDQKDAFEKEQEVYWKNQMTDLERSYGDDSGEENINVLINKVPRAKTRCYFLIGNALMSDHMDEVITGEVEEVEEKEEAQPEPVNLTDEQKENAETLTRAMLASVGKDMLDDNLICTMDVNSMTDSDFVSYANIFISNSSVASEAEDFYGPDGMYYGKSLPIATYNDICVNTLGRTEAYDVSSGENIVEGDSVVYDGFLYEVVYDIEFENVIQNSDGTISVEGKIFEPSFGGSVSNSAVYPFTMTGYSSDQSRIGMVLTNLVVTNP